MLHTCIAACASSDGWLRTDLSFRVWVKVMMSGVSATCLCVVDELEQWIYLYITCILAADIG
jgi:uncharacterized membrane protein YjjP (DUF1212 family)